MENYLILLYYPNLIGYLRLALTILAFSFFDENPHFTLMFYLLSQLFDTADGAVARLFHMETKFGYIFDMLVDRVSSIMFTSMLISVYPQYALPLSLSLALDFVSNWIHMYTSFLCREESHKKAKMFNPFLKAYYEYKILMFGLTAGYEIFLMSLYLGGKTNFFSDGFNSFSYYLLISSFPLYVVKQVHFSLLRLFIYFKLLIQFKSF